MGTLTYELDEFRPWSGPGARLLEAFVYGEAEIEFDADGAWEMTELRIDDCGSYEFNGHPTTTVRRAKGFIAPKNHGLFIAVNEAFRTHYASYLDAAISKARDEEQEDAFWQRVDEARHLAKEDGI